MSAVKKVAMLLVMLFAVSVFYDILVLKPNGTQSLQAAASSTKKDNNNNKFKKKIIDCASGKESKCRNMCSATYVNVTSKGEFSTKDCYETSEAKKNIEELASCIAKHSNPSSRIGSREIEILKKTLKYNLCILNSTVKHKPDGIEIKYIQGNENYLISIPLQCVNYIKRIEEIKSDTSKNNSKAKDECSINGPYVCWRDDNNKEYTCLYKNTSGTKDPKKPPTPRKGPQKPQGGDKRNTGSGAPELPPTPGAGAGGSTFSDAFDGSYNKTSDFMDKMLQGKLMQSLFGNKPAAGGSSGGSTAGAYRHPCDNPYYRVWNKEQCSGPQPVSCIILPSKTTVKKGEEITVKWEVQNANTHSILFNLGTNINKKVVYSSGSATSKKETVLVTPEQTGEIKLTATGSGDKNTCKQSVLITVEDSADSDTDSASSITCSPEIISPGASREITLNYVCPSGTRAVIHKKESTSKEYSIVGSFSDTSSTTKATVNSPTLFRLMCVGENSKPVSRSYCSVYSGESIADVIAYPKYVKENAYTRITWGSLGMSACVLKTPFGTKYERKSGSIITIPFPEGSKDTKLTYTLECASEYGGTYYKEIDVIRDY